MSQNQQKGISSAANLARLGHAVATVLQGAVSGGLHGAAVAAAKAFLPEIIKAIFYIILFCIFIPFSYTFLWCIPTSNILRCPTAPYRR